MEKITKEYAVKWLQVNQCIREDLISEFNQLRYDDKHFAKQYKENEFIEWIIDYHLQEEES